MPIAPCPYCGHIPDSPDASRCSECGGLFEPLSRKATQLAMGPWSVRDEARPFMPGFSEAILRHQVASGRIKADTIVRGPTTHQFWMRADQTPGLSRLLGKCHACGGTVEPDATSCDACHADLALPNEVDRLGLAYTNPIERQKAQDDVNAQRTGGAPPPKPARQRPDVVSSDLLELVEPEHEEPEQQETNEEAYGHSEAAHADDLASELADDLWHSDAPTATRRRRRKNEPDPIVLGLGVLLLCVVGIGLFIIVSGMGSGDDDADDGDTTAQGPPRPERSADEVEKLSSPVEQTYQALREAGVPEPFQETLSQAGSLIDLAKRTAEREQFTDAYEQFAEAQALLEPLPEKIEQWEADQAARGEAQALLDAVASLQSKANAADAKQWSKMFSVGEAALLEARSRFDRGEYARAGTKLDEAKQAYQEAIDAAEAAGQAMSARDNLIAAMENSQSEQALRRHASSAVDRLNAQRKAGADRFNAGDYTASRRAFEDALGALREAEQQVELAKYRKFYAYTAGYRAAGLLLAVAAGDGIDAETLKQVSDAFDTLSLPENPAAALKAGSDADYAQAADRLVNSARNAIAGRHGEQVQSSYHAGFQIRIVEQTLKTASLTEDQKKRIHQSLAEFERRAADAGWNIIPLRPVVEVVRSANRNAVLGKAPELTRETFGVLVKPMTQRESAARLMDPVLSPTTPQDPELFPGLGSAR